MGRRAKHQNIANLCPAPAENSGWQLEHRGSPQADSDTPGTDLRRQFANAAIFVDKN
jgi:hypothetical protein